jgi:hypothetical protein
MGYPRFVGHRRFPSSQQVQSPVPSQYPEEGMPPIAGGHFDVGGGATFQPDVAQFAQVRRSLAHANVRAIGDYPKTHEKSQAVKRTLNANRSVVILAANQPQRILQQTIERQSFIIGNRTGSIMYLSYGLPLAFVSGWPIAVNQSFERAGEQCPVDEIWVTSSVAGGAVAVYEGKTAWLSDQSEQW